MNKIKLSIACAVCVGVAPALYAEELRTDFALDAAVSAADLDSSRGRSSLYRVDLNELTESASLSGNSADAAITGANMAMEGAFSGMNGVSSVIQNTGNNVIIQDATIVNVNMH